MFTVYILQGTYFMLALQMPLFFNFIFPTMTVVLSETNKNLDI